MRVHGTSGIELDIEAFASCYDRRSLKLGHGLGHHPLLTVDAIADLTSTFPEAQMECNVGGLPELHPEGKCARVDADAFVEAVRGIAHNGCWVGFHRVETVPEYRELLDELLEPVAELVPAMGEREAYLFLSGASSVTPCHRDPEHNVLLQVQGHKQLTTGDYRDADTKERELERAYRHQDTYVEHLPVDPIVHELGPGQGVYLPPDALHMVRNGVDVSISFSVTWRPRSLVRVGRVYQVNGWLRDHGRSPSPPGRSGLADRVKDRLVWTHLALRRLRRIVRRSKP